MCGPSYALTWGDLTPPAASEPTTRWLTIFFSFDCRRPPSSPPSSTRYLRAENGTPFTVSGSGTPLRQFIYSRDLAKLFIWQLKGTWLVRRRAWL